MHLSPCLWLILNVSISAQPSDTWEGRYVLVARAGLEMRAGPDEESKVVGRVHDLTLTVRKANGDYVAVRSSGVDGWIKKMDVVPYNKAAAYFTERIAKNPKDAFSLTARAVAHGGYKDERTLADLDLAIQLDPKLPLAYEQRGYIAYGKKEYDKALADLNEAIRLDPQIRWPYHVRGWIWYPQEKLRQGARRL
jgi:tetratricopeptide (TPR) repeat protein